VKVLVVGEKKLSLGTIEVVVPDADGSQDDRKVLLQRSLLEVLVHAVSTLEELARSYHSR
jgi:lipoate synthase